MPRDLFMEVTDPSVRVASRSRYTLPFSLAAHLLIVAALVSVSMLAPAMLPALHGSGIVFAHIGPLPEPPVPPPPVRRATESAPQPVNPDAAPVFVPESIEPEPPAPADTGVIDGIDLAVPGTGVIGEIEAEPAPPPPPPAPVRAGHDIQAPVKIVHVAPSYPVIALSARVQGTVILDAIIGTSGRVESVRVLRSIPLLDEAALGAVRQWVFVPSRINGRLVPVALTVTVTFRLD
jgi:protein TonB